METANVTLFLALGAGLLSFISPCVLPIVPAYLGHLAGVALRPEEMTTGRWRVLAHALGFILGFSLVFVLLGASFGLVGGLLYGLRSALQKVGGIVLVLFGLHSLGAFKIPLLYRTLRLKSPTAGRWGVLSSVFVGAVFGAAWTPCVGPILASILLLAGSTGTAGQGALLLLVYSVGLGIPFALVGLFLKQMTPLLKRVNRYGQAISIISGIFLVLMGILVFTDMLALLTGYLWNLFDFNPIL